MNLENVRHMLLMKFMTRSFIRFLIVGIVNTLATYVLYLLFLMMVSYNIAYSFSYILGILFSYYLNSVFVFKKKVNIITFIKFPVVYIAQYLFNIVFINFFVLYLHLPESIAPLISIVLAIPITFGLSRMVFKK